MEVDGGLPKATLGYTRMGVCTYTRKGSPFFWLQWGPSNDRSQISSKVRLDDADADFKLAKKINKIEATMLIRHTGVGWDWVPGFFSAQYRNSKESLRIHRTAWNWVAAWLRAEDIREPSQLTNRGKVMEYLDWRMSRRKEKSGRTPCRNTALYEMRILGRVMAEAILRDMAEKNPAAKLGLKRDVPEPKPEILPDQQGTILDALGSKPDWMRKPFRIALQTGLRYKETKIDLIRNVNWPEAKVTIPAPKGGTDRAFTFPIMQGSLVPYLADLKSQHRITWQMPGRLPKPYALIWRDFFDDLGMEEITFHCTRVTFITWCQRSRIPEAVTMQLVNHASEEIHRIYQRLTAVEVRPWLDHLAAVIPQLAAPSGPRAAAGVSTLEIPAR